MMVAAEEEVVDSVADGCGSGEVSAVAPAAVVVVKGPAAAVEAAVFALPAIAVRGSSFHRSFGLTAAAVGLQEPDPDRSEVEELAS